MAGAVIEADFAARDAAAALRLAEARPESSRPAAADVSAELVASAVGHAFGPRTVLENVSFSVARGQTLALVGPSGCGKTTLLHLVAGLLTLREGTIANRFASTACMFQQPRLLPWKTARENIALGLAARGVARGERLARSGELGARLGLGADDLAKFPHELSGGMQSRVALGRALVLDPQLLLLDEPFSSLDIGLKTELYALLAEQQASRGMAVLMITHDLMEAVRLSDRILVMVADPGRIARRLVLRDEQARRDDDWVYRSTAALLRDPVVRLSFGLQAAAGAAQPAPSGAAAATFAIEDAPPAAKSATHRC